MPAALAAYFPDMNKEDLENKNRNMGDSVAAGAGCPAMGSQDTSVLKEVTESDYKYGFVSDIDTDKIPVGLSEEVVRLISQKKGEPEWMLDFRLKAYRHWLTMTPPEWGHLRMPDIDFQAISYYAAPVKKEGP